MRLAAHDLEVVKSLHKISNRRLGWSSAQQIVVMEDCSNFRGCRIVCQFLELRMESTINLPNCTLPNINRVSWKGYVIFHGKNEKVDWWRPLVDSTGVSCPDNEQLSDVNRNVKCICRIGLRSKYKSRLEVLHNREVACPAAPGQCVWLALLRSRVRVLLLSLAGFVFR